MSIRAKGDKIGMWLGDSNAGESILTVGKKFKERLNIDPQVRFLIHNGPQSGEVGEVCGSKCPKTVIVIYGCPLN